MTSLALCLVLLAALTHACWNLSAKYAADSRHFVWLFSAGSVLVYGPIGAAVLLGETPTTQSIIGLLLIVGGILLVAGLIGKHERAPGRGVFYGLLTGALIAAYTLNDGWAVKVLLISPFVIDFTGNLFRMIVLAPRAWRDRAVVAHEARLYRNPVIVVSVLGPLGYILVLFAMRLAPVSHVAPARELSTLVGAWFGSRMLRESSGRGVSRGPR